MNVLRLRSVVIPFVCLLNCSSFAAKQAPLAQKLPAQTSNKHTLAYFSFDQRGASLENNLVQSAQTIQTGSARYTAKGLHHGALLLNGTSGQLLLPLVSVKELTLSVWLLPRRSANMATITACTFLSSQNTLTIRLHNNGTVEIEQTTPFSQSSASQNMGLGIPNNQWLHLAVVVTPSQLTVYLNGQFSGNFALPIEINGASLLIADPTFRGTIDELALFKDALSAQEIQAVHAMFSPSALPGMSPMSQNLSWENQAANIYKDLTNAINSGNWSNATAQAKALTDQVATYPKNHKTNLNAPSQESIQENLSQSVTLLKSFIEAIEQGKYHQASDVFDTLDEVWEALEDQLGLPSMDPSQSLSPLNAPGASLPMQFRQTWRSNSGNGSGAGFSGGMVTGGRPGQGGVSSGGFSMSSSMGPNGQVPFNSSNQPGSGFSGGMVMGGERGQGGVSSGGFSMSSSMGPNGQVQFNSSGQPGQGFMNQAMGQMPPMMTNNLLSMQCQRIQMSLNALKMNLQNAHWQMVQTHLLHLKKLFSQIDVTENILPQSNTRRRRRSLNLSTLPSTQKSAIRKQVKNAHHHLNLLSTAVKKKDLQTALKQIQAMEKVSEALNQIPNIAHRSPGAAPIAPNQ